MRFAKGIRSRSYGFKVTDLEDDIGRSIRNAIRNDNLDLILRQIVDRCDRPAAVNDTMQKRTMQATGIEMACAKTGIVWYREGKFSVSIKDILNYLELQP